MGRMREFTLGSRAFLRFHRWRRIDPVPWAVPDKPMGEARLGLVASAALVLPGQEPFDGTVKGGDWSLREMCNQTIGLIAAELERRRIPTVCSQLLREAAVAVRPPRGIFVPFRHGFPLDTPNDPARQRRVIEAASR